METDFSHAYSNILGDVKNYGFCFVRECAIMSATQILCGQSEHVCFVGRVKLRDDRR